MEAVLESSESSSIRWELVIHPERSSLLDCVGRQINAESKRHLFYAGGEEYG